MTGRPIPSSSAPDPSSGAPSSGFDVQASGLEAGDRYPLPGPESYEEADRELAARAFVNGAADYLLRKTLGRLCKPRVCVACGITFLGFSDRDVLCHVDVGRPQ